MPRTDALNVLERALEMGAGILRLAPTWVPRVAMIPGGRLQLDPRDLYALGPDRGAIDERWLASTTQADNGPATPEDEGLSYIMVEPELGTERILLRDAIDLAGDKILGTAVRENGGWNVLTKFFDTAEPIPFHMHPDDAQAGKVGKSGKAEAYYFPPQLNAVHHRFPLTYFGLQPGTTPDDIKGCLERWDEGDNQILDHSRNYALEPGTAWDVPAGILHAPGTLLTYELQQASDVVAVFQSSHAGRPMPREMLVKDVPPEFHRDLDYIVRMLDWEKNVDSEFERHRRIESMPIGDLEVTRKEGYQELWIIHGSPCFSAKELIVFPGQTATLQDHAAYGLIVIQGRGRVGSLPVESPTRIRFGEMTADELFVTAAAASNVTVMNESDNEELVVLKHFDSGHPGLPSIQNQKIER